MLALRQKDKKADATAVHVLPCRIAHNGPTKVTKRYWAPTTGKDGSRASHFRGRQLKGKAAELPAGYEGVIVRTSSLTLPPPNVHPHTSADDDSDVEEIDPEASKPVKILESTSKFEEIVVWGHDQAPPSDDQFVKGIDEWISFATAIHQT